MVKDIAVLLSGGVDSSVVVHLLCEQGYKPNLFYIKIGSDEDNNFDCSAEEDIQLSQLIARKYGLTLEIVDLHEQYWDNVVSYIVEKSASGLTPNPDVMCNKLIKFGCFEQNIGYQYEKTATGHYATIREKDGYLWLGTAKDTLKDQTDFLCQINYLQLSKLMFPIGNLKKEEVRSIAKNAGLASARRKDSQGICFLGKISYNDLLRHYLGEKEGKIVEYETGRILGTHKGFWFHTIGQRKGLGLSGGPWFVIDKDKDENIVYISKDVSTDLQYGDEIILRDFHFITHNPGFTDKPIEITYKNRHTPDFISGTIMFQDDKYIIKSSQKIQGIAPGQFGVVYDKDSEICFGSGEISIN